MMNVVVTVHLIPLHLLVCVGRTNSHLDSVMSRLRSSDTPRSGDLQWGREALYLRLLRE